MQVTRLSSSYGFEVLLHLLRIAAASQHGQNYKTAGRPTNIEVATMLRLHFDVIQAVSLPCVPCDRQVK